MSWTATGEGWRLSWSAAAPHLAGDADLVASVLGELEEVGLVAVTPTGPTIRTDPADGLAVLTMLRALPLGSFVLSGDVPPVPSVPADAVA